MVKLRDVEMRRTGGEAAAHGEWDGHDTSDSQSAKVEFCGQSWGGECESVCDDGAVQEAMVEAKAGRYGQYQVGSRWHERTLIAMLRQFGSTSLAWRYGDG